jgi:hypothetical protein
MAHHSERNDGARHLGTFAMCVRMVATMAVVVLSACATRTADPSNTDASSGTTDTVSTVSTTDTTGPGGTPHITLPSLPDLPKLPHVPDLPSVPAIATVKAATKNSGITERMGQAAMTPLRDLNVVREAIPPALHAATKGPYAAHASVGCEAIVADLAALDEALGADFDDPNIREKPSLLTRGIGLAENAGVSAVRRTMEGFVPFRSWLRELSGAEKHSKQVAAAITAGSVRRAYLKGRRDAMGCAVPSAQGTTP